MALSVEVIQGANDPNGSAAGLEASCETKASCEIGSENQPANSVAVSTRMVTVTNAIRSMTSSLPCNGLDEFSLQDNRFRQGRLPIGWFRFELPEELPSREVAPSHFPPEQRTSNFPHTLCLGNAPYPTDGLNGLLYD